MKPSEECEEIGHGMTKVDFFELENPELVLNNLKSGYLRLKYANLLIGFVKKESESIEDKIEVFKHVSDICGYKPLSEEDIIKQIDGVSK